MSVCENQKNFNHAIYNAVKDYDRRERRQMSGFVTFYIMLHLVFLIWGVMLALTSVPKENRVLHITLAVLFSPAYVMSYYLDTLVE
jgi:hypothetical protein